MKGEAGSIDVTADSFRVTGSFARLGRLRQSVAPRLPGAGSGGSRPPPTKKAASVGEVAGQFVFEPQFLFLEAMEKVFVRVGSMLFLVDQGVKSGMLRFDFLGNCLVHWCVPFRLNVTTLQ